MSSASMVFIEQRRNLIKRQACQVGRSNTFSDDSPASISIENASVKGSSEDGGWTKLSTVNACWTARLVERR
jgi:hypothetical protein